jgi:rhodanese-related sulfurtransferase
MVIKGNEYLSPQEAYALLSDDAILVDLRDDSYKNGREFDVKNVIPIFYRNLETDYMSLPRDKKLILADYVGLRSKEAMLFLKNRGFDNVASLIGGVVNWEQEGLPLKIDHGEELVGSCACQLKPRKRVKI